MSSPEVDKRIGSHTGKTCTHKFTRIGHIVEGYREGERTCYSYYVLDKYDEKTQTTSMARTTGYTCAIVARQVIRGLFSQKGICPPEFLGRTEGCYDDLQTEYRRRNIQMHETITKQK